MVVLNRLGGLPLFLHRANPLRYVTEVQFINGDGTELRLDVKIQHGLVRAHGPGGWTNQQIDVLLDNGRNCGHLPFGPQQNFLGQLKGLAVGVKSFLIVTALVSEENVRPC